VAVIGLSLWARLVTGWERYAPFRIMPTWPTPEFVPSLMALSRCAQDRTHRLLEPRGLCSLRLTCVRTSLNADRPSFLAFWRYELPEGSIVTWFALLPRAWAWGSGPSGGGWPPVLTSRAGRIGWRTTEEAIEAFYRAGGRPTAAWRLLRDEGVAVPSHTAFCRALERDLSPAERGYARHGEDGRRRYSVYRRWEPKARNEVWETDHDELDIKVLPLRGRRLVRPWLTVIEDGFSRLVMGWALSLYPTSAEVLVAIREGIVIDPERGPWGGVPQLIRFDGGREFLANAVKRAAGELGCAALPAAPYSPHHKGKVERLHRTIGDRLIATLPHYTGAPRRANGKLYAQPAPLSLPQLQTRVREFIDAYNAEHRHSSLGGMTPAEKWSTSAAPLEVIEPERLRWMLLADQERKVLKDGIHFENAIFIAPELTGIGGKTVEVRYMPHDLRSIEVFTEDGWLCTAYPQDQLTREQAEAVIAQRREAAREMGRRKAAASRKARARIAPLTAGGTVQDITAIVRDRDHDAAKRDAETGELLEILGLADQLNKPIPPSSQEQAEA
jgi:putative transposase